MLQDDVRGFHIWTVDITRNASRDFGIDKAVVSYVDLMLPLCHEVKGLKVVMVAGDVICHSGLKNRIISRSIRGCHIDRDPRVSHSVRDRV
jgi:hypothetical protein